jgi:predicted ATPase
MDAARAGSLILIAEEARDARRRGADAGLETFEAAHDDLRSALDWFLAAGRADDAFRLSASMTPLWLASKRVDEGMSWLESALATGQGSDASRARALHAHGYLALFCGHYVFDGVGFV